MLKPETVFWMVWSPRGGLPVVRHVSLAKAAAEALRLAEKHHGRHFYVLEEAGYAMVGAPTLTAKQLAKKKARKKPKPTCAPEKIGV